MLSHNYQTAVLAAHQLRAAGRGGAAYLPQQGSVIIVSTGSSRKESTVCIYNENLHVDRENLTFEEGATTGL